MRVLRTLLASLLIVAAGIATLAAVTHGFRAFTVEGARRIAVSEHPRALPAASLQTAGGDTIELASLHGRWLLVDFIYTRCLTYCSVQGNEFARLEKRLSGPIADGRVALLSISFDPSHDVHNAAINVVDPAGRLVAILDWNDAAAAERYVRARLQP